VFDKDYNCCKTLHRCTGIVNITNLHITPRQIHAIEQMDIAGVGLTQVKRIKCPKKNTRQDNYIYREKK
jgi:hypothetical protein